MQRILQLACAVTILFTSLFTSLCSLAQERASTPPPATVTGSGTANYVPRWTGTSTLGNSVMFQTGGKIGVGTTAPAVALDVDGRVNVSKSFRIGNVDVLVLPGTNDTAVGVQALQLEDTGSQNTALGVSALQNEEAGIGNTASGYLSLQGDLSGNDNTADGEQSLKVNSGGSDNTAIGSFALENNKNANSNTAIGFQALLTNSTGGNNTAIGADALQNNFTGRENIAIGHQAAVNVSGFNSNNIHIGNKGFNADTGAVRIGTSGTQTSFFAAGVSGVTTGMNDAVPVVIDSNGQLGTISSSRRYKEDIQEMGDVSEGLMRLRPVTFRYQKAFTDGSKPVQYGLIAEEVAEVYPDLVTHSADGQVETVKYQVLDSMLLNELQRQQKVIESLEHRLAKMEAELSGENSKR